MAQLTCLNSGWPGQGLGGLFRAFKTGLLKTGARLKLEL